MERRELFGGGISQRPLLKQPLNGPPDNFADRTIFCGRKLLEFPHDWIWKKNLYFLHGSMLLME